MKRISILVIVLALAIPAAASAASSSCQAYNPQLCAVAHADAPGPTASGTLPFTGLDVALLAAGGGGLLGIGLVVRRFARRPHA